MGRDDFKQSPEQVRRTQELRRSGAAGTHDPRPNRSRTRSEREREALEEQQGRDD